MANPKRRMTRTRTRTRRAHDALEAATTVVCRNCGERMQPHRVCPQCGYYKSRKWHKPVVSVGTE